MGNNSASEIKSIVERIERIEEEKAGLVSDISDIYKEADKALYESKRSGKNRVTVAAAALASD